MALLFPNAGWNTKICVNSRAPCPPGERIAEAMIDAIAARMIDSNRVTAHLSP